VDNLTRLAAEQKPCDAAATVRGHDDKIAAEFFGCINNSLGGRIAET
jgi:hypothetical protein